MKIEKIVKIKRSFCHCLEIELQRQDFEVD